MVLVGDGLNSCRTLYLEQSLKDFISLRIYIYIYMYIYPCKITYTYNQGANS